MILRRLYTLAGFDTCDVEGEMHVCVCVLMLSSSVCVEWMLREGRTG